MVKNAAIVKFCSPADSQCLTVTLDCPCHFIFHDTGSHHTSCYTARQTCLWSSNSTAYLCSAFRRHSIHPCRCSDTIPANCRNERTDDTLATSLGIRRHLDTHI